jgi:trehalose utilization protein
MKAPVRVTVWNEYRHELEMDVCRKLYPRGMHGLTDEVLANTDVLTWWGHAAHHEVSDSVTEKVCQRVMEGMGLIVLHSGHMSKPFRKLMGTDCMLRWREAGEKERIWTINVAHPIADGIGDYFELEHTEMYGEHFGIPTPDDLVFVSWFEGGEVFRSGCVFYRGLGKVFYFRPGHETYPIYHNETVLKVIANACRWAKPLKNPPACVQDHQPVAFEPIKSTE